ncbi:MAG: patatin-like phospholipase family protein, partial [Flavobacteriales bacterium]|nr:patatin-like phospholipase family protein [Flavobacteriales bacterium]
TAEEAVNLYLLRGGDIFKKSARKKFTGLFGLTDEVYDEKNIEKVLNDVFDKAKLSELRKPCLITSYDIFRRKAHFFTQHDAKQWPAADYSVVDVCRSTSAAPTYFEVNKAVSETGVEYPLIDGGVFVNNPALCAYAEARTLFPKNGDGNMVTAKDMFILSLGTGTKKKAYEYKKAKDWGKIEWISPLIDIMMSGVSETVDFQLRQIYDAIDLPNQYVRIQPTLGDASTEMDDAEGENLHALRMAGTESAEANNDTLDRIVDTLIAQEESSVAAKAKPSLDA